ncbi:MAG: sulfotransferase domain-containing protein [Ekhidna sp.]|nr:sulfotransferase domain-containing protein [Ekhidna sp.]
MGVEIIPNFLIGGVAAGGTSLLANALIQHPDIFLPAEMRPEPHYFYKSWEYAKGSNYYMDKWFSGVQQEKATGERSSSYLFDPTVAGKVKEFNPSMKWIFMLRNPIERTWGNYRYTVLEGLERLSFWDALQQEEERINNQEGMWAEIQPYNYTGRGFYYAQLQPFFQNFDSSQILLLRSEDVAKNSQVNLEKIYDFLGVEGGFVPEMPPNHTAVSVKNREVQADAREYFKDRFDLFVEGIRREQDPIDLINSEDDRVWYEKFKENLVGTKKKMPTDCREYLQNLFAEDINKLSSVVEFETKDWN